MCTSGEAKKAIKRYEGTSNGYTLALEILKERFGQPYQIVRSCLDKLTKGARITVQNRGALLEFADLLVSTHRTLQDQDQLAKANTQSTLKAIFDRLPTQWQAKWVKRVIDFEAKGQSPKLCDLVGFVHDLAKAANHAVFTVTSTGGSDFAKSSRKKDQGKGRFGSTNQATDKKATVALSTMSTQVQQKSDTQGQQKSNKAWRESKPRVESSSQVIGQSNNATNLKRCGYCDGKHSLWECDTFKVKQVDFRRKFVRNGGYCFCCLGRHYAKNCKSQKTCTVKGCDNNHHPLLHQDKPAQTQTTEAKKQTVTCGALGSEVPFKPRMVLLKVIPVTVQAENGKSITTFAILDSGSTATMVTKAVGNLLGIRGTPETISVNTVIVEGMNQDVVISRCLLTPVGRAEPQIPVERAHFVESLNISQRYRPDSLNLSDWDHLRDLDLAAEVEERSVSVLIGEEVPWAHAVLESSYGDQLNSQPYAVKTPLAWCMAGPAQSLNTSLSQISVNFIQEESTSGDNTLTDEKYQSLENAVKRLWEEEKYGFTCNGEKAISVEDKRGLKISEDTTKIVDGQYQTGLLWCKEDPVLPNNRAAAEKRLK
ncbi:uncharacterized protein LOC135488576 [Lineus longissimus]|uniref:uncharacterized protein LOC135488576 n=1 Tax=Lineus longissimus TaxID=88925 RepID=UPI00315C4D77